MSILNFPNPARRARLLHAHQLRQQGLTLRQIADKMDCAHSTVAAYLSDFELFRADLIHELSADQIVTHLIQLADVDDDRHDKRLAAVRELRLLLATLPEIRRDEGQRATQLVQAGIEVDRYGVRYAKPDRLYPPSQEEIDQAGDPPPFEPEPDQPLACIPTDTHLIPQQDLREVPPSLSLPSPPAPSTEIPPFPSPPAPPTEIPPFPSPPAERGEMSRSDRGGSPSDQEEHTRTNPNKSEQEINQSAAHNGISSKTTRKFPPPTEPPPPDPDEPLEHDWNSAYPQRNPWPHNRPSRPSRPSRTAAIERQAQEDR